MKRKTKFMLSILLICIVLGVTACGKCNAENNGKEQSSVNDACEKRKKVIQEDYLGVGGYLTDNNVYDYSAHFETTYEWMDDVVLPIKKPDNMEVKFDEYGLIITDYREEDINLYIDELKEEGFKVIEYVGNPQFTKKRYMASKDGLNIMFDEQDEKINVYVLTGNVIGERSVSIKKVKEMLGQEYSEHIFIEISYNTVAAEGYCEFLVIPKEYFSLTQNDASPYYVIADNEKVLLCEENLWNPIYPVSVNLIKSDENIELIINANETSGSRSAHSVYPVMRKYILKDGVFEKVEEKEIWVDRPIIGEYDGKDIEYYTLKKNENYDVNQGRKNLWVIDEEYDIK